MRRFARALSVCVIIAVTNVMVAAQERPAKATAIVLLHSYGHDAPFRAVFDAAFARALRDAGVITDLYIESLDPNRFRGEAEQQRTRAYLQQRYAGKDVSVVVAVYGLALDFLLDGREPLFPGVPIAAALTRSPHNVPAGVPFIWSGDSVAQTLRTALRLHPRTRQIVIIDGGPVRTERDVLGQELRAQVLSVGASQATTFLRDLPLDVLLQRVRELPADSVILLARQLLGRRGEPISNLDAVRQVSAVAPAPVYITTDQQLDSGAIGGVLISAESMGRSTAQLALRVAANAASVLPVEDELIPMFDWRELRRWNVAGSSLPAGSIVLFQQLNVWEKYRGYMAAALGVITLQAMLVGRLLLLAHQRRRSERALQDSDKDLRRSVEKNHDLAGRLINAQELERTRIARELHDDVSQQVAGLAIALSALRRMGAQSGVGAEIDHTMAQLQDRTSVVAQSIRTLSHQLHPSVLQHAGLLATLQGQCADIAQLHAIDVRFSSEGDVTDVDSTLALCVFRVAQEAIQNAVRHARATTLTVKLTAMPSGLELQVSDNGVGLQVDRGSGSGLRLRSMDERARLVGGHVTIDSRLGRGTTVHLGIGEAESGGGNHRLTAMTRTLGTTVTGACE